MKNPDVLRLPEDHEVEETQVQDFALKAPQAVSHPRLRWTDGGTHERVLRELTLLGSAPNTGIVIDDRAVSRLHAELDPRADGVWVRDLGSRNGTFVDGVFVTRARLSEGSKLRIGSTEVVVEYGTPEDLEGLWPESTFGPLVGCSAPMRRLFANLARIAPTDAPVLIQGETGTGKELVAQAIHQRSARAGGPFVIVDCAALPENLIESELFGHAKGAFTGALRTRIGAIEAASGGTVFLDEIGELPLSLQPRLLRVLESGTIRMVGETSRKKVDVRFLSATHRDIGTMINAGAFREDLYFRLAVLPIFICPLRERIEDIPALIEAFMPKGTLASPELVRELMKRPWLGNARELRNFVQRAAAFGTGQALLMSSQPSSSIDGTAAAVHSGEGVEVEVASLPFEGDFRTFRERWVGLGEREFLRRLLVKHDRNVSAVAKEAGLDRTYVYRMLRNHGL